MDSICSRWNGLGVDLSGSTVGVIGMGNIGIKIARRAKAFDCKVRYFIFEERDLKMLVGAVGCNYEGEMFCLAADWFQELTGGKGTVVLTMLVVSHDCIRK